MCLLRVIERKAPRPPHEKILLMTPHQKRRANTSEKNCWNLFMHINKSCRGICLSFIFVWKLIYSNKNEVEIQNSLASGLNPTDTAIEGGVCSLRMGRKGRQGEGLRKQAKNRGPSAWKTVLKFFEVDKSGRGHSNSVSSWLCVPFITEVAHRFGGHTLKGTWASHPFSMV